MTPHDLINLPGAGNAEKWLRANGMWHITMTDTERIEWMMDNAMHVELRGDEIIPVFGDFFRDDLDKAASQTAMKKPKEPKP